MKAVIYARFSSYAQTEQSIEGQLRVCNEYAERNGYEIINEYIERAKTGTNDKRPVFLQMIEDCKSKEFERVIVYKFDRFARNQYDSIIYKHKIAQYGVKVVSATEIISDTPEGALMEGLLEMFAEMYSKDLSQKVKRGARENLINGKYLGGYCLLGYKVENKRILIDEEKAKIVRYAFENYAQGKPRKQIIEELNSMGYTNSLGQKFTDHSMQANFTNKKYIGIVEHDGVVYKNVYPAIISEDLFNQVQEQVKKHKIAPASSRKVEYLLTGKAFCGHCGATMIGIHGNGRSKKYYYYTCSARYNKHLCNKKNEYQKDLEDFVVDSTLKHILKPERIKEITNALLKAYEEETVNKQIKKYEQEIAQLDKKFDHITQLIIQATSEEILKRLDDQAKDLEIQRKDLSLELSKLKLGSKINTKEKIEASLLAYLSGETQSEDYKRKIINVFVNSVWVFDDQIIIYYNILDTNKPVTFEEMKTNLQENLQVGSSLKGIGSSSRT